MLFGTSSWDIVIDNVRVCVCVTVKNYESVFSGLARFGLKAPDERCSPWAGPFALAMKSLVDFGHHKISLEIESAKRRSDNKAHNTTHRQSRDDITKFSINTYQQTNIQNNNGTSTRITIITNAIFCG